MQNNPSHPCGSREEAGRELARLLTRFSTPKNVIVLALPNGGVPVGAEIAGILNKPFDVLFIEPITTPACGGVPLGAITAGGVRMLNCAMIDRLHLSTAEISSAVLHGSLKLAKRERSCRGQYPPLEVADHVVILVDDGATPCATIRDAVHLLRRQHADCVIVAFPDACRHTLCDLRLEADEVVTLADSRATRHSVKSFHHFPRMTDAEVHHVLADKCAKAGAGN